ncbi:hypothetical protein [Winogradskyella sp. PE311]|uniref:hypothetical protein n=1 Tax=Winogradskyella sp. PE311 TaxID=3366943 RepID=UPI00397F6CED
MKNLILLVLLFSFSATTYSCAQTKATQKEKFQSTYNSVKSNVKSKAYKFIGEVVYSNKDRTLLEGDNNEITIAKNEASGFIKALVSSKNVDVSGVIENYLVSYDDDKQQISIKFEIKNDEFYIDIKPNGNAFLTFKSGTDYITQVGKIEKL